MERKSPLRQSVESSNAYRKMMCHVKFGEQNGGIDALMKAIQQRNAGGNIGTDEPVLRLVGNGTGSIAPPQVTDEGKTKEIF